MNPRNRLLSAILAGALPAFASASDSVADADVSPVPKDAVDMGRTTIVGTRRERSLATIAQKTEIVTRADIEATPATDLADLLKKTSGVDVVQYPGLLAGVGVRGFRPQTSGLNQRTLVLVDGRPAGASSLSTMSLLDVDHVEIVKGPSSALFGPMAMGGVINVVTTRGATRPWAELAVGSFGRVEGSFGAGGRDTGSGFFWEAGGRVANQSDDYRVGRSRILRDWFGWDENVPTTDSDTGNVKIDSGDGATRAFTRYRETQGVVGLGWGRGPWLVRSRAFVYDAPSVQSPGSLGSGASSQGLKNLERYGLDLMARGRFGEHLVTLQGFRSREYSENWYVAKNYRYNDNTNDWTGLQARDNASIGMLSLTAGVDWNIRETATMRWSSANERIAPNNPDYAIQDVAGYGEAAFDPWHGLLVATAGFRFDAIGFETKATDHLPGFHPETRWFQIPSPSMGAVSLLPFGFRLHGSLGRGFVTPDAYQVAGYTVSTPDSRRPHEVSVIYGNPGLDPENNWAFDGGLGFERLEAGLSLDATFFVNKVEDKIVSRVRRTNAADLGYVDGDTIASVTSYENADEADYRGFELSGSWDAAKAFDWRWGLRLFGNSTIYSSIDETTKTDSGDVTADAMNVGTNWTCGIETATPDGTALRLSTRYAGRRKDVDWTDPRSPVIRYPAFLVTDLSLIVPVAEKTRMALSVGNLTDENYYEKRGYNMPGRNWRLSLRRTF